MSEAQKRVAIFVSGTGTNCENIIRYFAGSEVVNIALVVSNKSDAPALEKARRLGVPTEVVSKSQLSDSSFMLPLLRERDIHFIVLAGFLLMIPDYLIAAYPRRIINLHPSLLPKFGGKGMYGHRVHEAVKAAGETETGMTVHYVTGECDGGEIIAQYKTAISPEDTPEDIAAKENLLEMRYYPLVIKQVLQNP
ncbi:putative phosphoribosylglycinamide formyltransferase [Prevotella sp. CAG:1320]|nr:putative phosphoribosylglycinamide formyltransferase [Prevotella sp. CAG:1320]